MRSKVTKSSRLAVRVEAAWAAAGAGTRAAVSAQTASVTHTTPRLRSRNCTPPLYRMVDTIVACETCGLAQRLGPLGPGQVAECARCRARLADHKRNGLARTAAFSLAALCFYVPANLFPILTMDLYGVHSENTVWEGCKVLFERGELLVALVVFLASLVIPCLKLLGLFFLTATARLGVGRAPRFRTWLYRGIDFVGPWAML